MSTTFPKPASDLLPVAIAKDGFTPAQATGLLGRFANQEAMQGGDVSLFGFLNFPEVQKTAIVARTGPVVALENAIDPTLGKVRVNGHLGEMSLDEYLVDPRSRVQGIAAVHRGRIVFERYPGMRPNGYHVWMSATKTQASLIVRLLAEEGKVDVNAPVETYVSGLGRTAWKGVKVIDVLDMRTGMDAVESVATRADPDSITMRMNLAGSGVPYKGKVETMLEVLQAARSLKSPGLAFDYGSPITLALVMLAEEVAGRRWCDLFEERVWSRMTVEGDMLMGVAPDGLALAHGLAISRLRDAARFGMLYTPSWKKAARERIVSEAYVNEIQSGGDASIYFKGEMGNAMVKYFAGEHPVSNHWQWDAVFADGDFYKSGLMGQGIYVSPSRDAVVAFFSTVYDSNLAAYARAIAKAL